MHKVSAVVLCYNQWNLLIDCVESIKAQTHQVSEIIIIDDNSQDYDKVFEKNICKDNISFHRNSENKGRGFCRNLAIKECKSDYVFFCDSTNIACKYFVEKALASFTNKNIASVGGRILDGVKTSFFSQSWRNRHLFKSEHDYGTSTHNASSLNTYGVLINCNAVKRIGNFNPSLRHSEDRDLGKRLLNAGYKIIGDPNLIVYSIKKDSVLSVLERYWRWYGGTDEKFTLKDYWHAIKASFRPMIQEDIKAYDWRSAFISFLCPHFGFLRHLYRKLSGKIQKLF